MFNVGKEYIFTFLNRDEGGLYEVTETWEIVSIEGSLLSLIGPDMSDNPFLEFSTPPGQPVVVPPRKRMILNVNSAMFHKAEPLDDDEEIQISEIHHQVINADGTYGDKIIQKLSTD